MSTIVEVTPGTDLIQPAVANLNGGPGTIRLAAGVHQVTTSIHLGHSQHLLGAGIALGTTREAIEASGTLIQYLPNASTTVPLEDRWGIAVHDARGAQGWSIRNLKLSGSPVGRFATRAGGIKVSTAHHGRIERVAIDQFVIDSPTEGVSCETLLATGSCGTGILLADRSFYNLLLQCRLSNCNALVRFAGRSNSNRMFGGELSGSCTSGVIIEDSTDVGVWGVSIEPNSRFAHVELIGAAHCTVLGNRIESSGDGERVPGTTWHYSCDKASHNNLFHGNQFVTHPGRTGIAYVRNPAGIATRERIISCAPWGLHAIGASKREGLPLKKGGGLPVTYRTHVPDDWDRQTPPVLVLTLTRASADTGDISCAIEADGLAAGDVLTPVAYTETIAAAGPAETLHRAEIALSGALTADDDVLEVRIDRAPCANEYDDKVYLALVELRYRATTTRIDRSVV